MKGKISSFVLTIAAVIVFVNVAILKDSHNVFKHIDLTSLTGISKAFAQGESGSDVMHVAYKPETIDTYTDSYPYYIEGLCLNVVIREHNIDCIGKGTIGCTPSHDIQILSSSVGPCAQY